MMRLIYRVAEFLRRQHITYQHRHAAYRSRMLYEQYTATARDLSAALFAEKLAENKLASAGIPAKNQKKPLSDHEVRRVVWLEILIIYGAFIGLAIWNWW